MQYFKINRGTITLNNSEILKEGMVVNDSVFDGYENKEEMIKSLTERKFLTSTEQYKDAIGVAEYKGENPISGYEGNDPIYGLPMKIVNFMSKITKAEYESLKNESDILRKKTNSRFGAWGRATV
jgi:hypothetical protein